MPGRVSIRILFLILLCACFVAALPSARASELSHARIVRLSYTAGQVQYRTDDHAGWQTAVVNTPLREGMQLATADGRAEIEFETGATAWMASNTMMELSQLVLDDGEKLTLLTVTQGTATFYVTPAKVDSFAVQAGQLQIHPPRKARFRVDVFDDGSSVSVFHGPVEVDSRDTTFHVNSRRTLAFRNEQITDGTLEANPHADAWDHWVSDRDSSIEQARSNTAGYLDAPYAYGLADLSFYGGWINLPGYGYGWQPYGAGLGWSPFFNGYWSSFGAFGPAWVSYEPWGWVPYHYGGWVFLPGAGWVWTPTRNYAWSPATVAFVHTPSGAVGWVPRSPQETIAVGTTPVNLGHGVITAGPDGLPGHSPNLLLRGSATNGTQLVSDLRSDPAMQRFAQHASDSAQNFAPTAPRGLTPAQRMPEKGAPRVANAGLLSGAVPRYQAPSIFRHSAQTSAFSAPVGSPVPAIPSGASRSTGSPAMSGGSHGVSGGSVGGGGGRRP